MAKHPIVRVDGLHHLPVLTPAGEVFSFDVGGKMVSRTLKNLTLIFGERGLKLM
jgi:hypothetical protein